MTCLVPIVEQMEENASKMTYHKTPHIASIAKKGRPFQMLMLLRGCTPHPDPLFKAV